MSNADLSRLALAAAAVAAGVVGIADLEVPLRSVLVVGFLVFGPGAAFVPWTTSLGTAW